MQVNGYIGKYLAVVRARTYTRGETMRDRDLVPSPTDCIWMIPGMND